MKRARCSPRLTISRSGSTFTHTSLRRFTLSSKSTTRRSTCLRRRGQSGPPGSLGSTSSPSSTSYGSTRDSRRSPGARGRSLNRNFPFRTHETGALNGPPLRFHRTIRVSDPRTSTLGGRRAGQILRSFAPQGAQADDGRHLLGREGRGRLPIHGERRQSGSGEVGEGTKRVHARLARQASRAEGGSGSHRRPDPFRVSEVLLV